MARGFKDSGYHWLDSIHQQSFLPCGEWDEVQKVLGYALARLIHQNLPSLSPSQRSALFNLLGRRFYETFMQSCKIEFTFDVDDRTLLEMKCYLEETLKEALKDSKLDVISLESRPLEDFRKQLQRLYQTLLEDTVLGEQNKGEKHEHDGLFDSQQEMTRNSKSEMLLMETFNNPTTTSNLIGEGVNHILQRLPHLLDKVCFKLEGHQLPTSLRRTIWMWTLVSQNGKAEYVSEELIREEFLQRLALKMAQLQIKMANSSPMRGLIKMMILEKFKSTPCLQLLDKTRVSLVVEQAMNIYNVCFEKCDPMSILLLFALHMGFLADHADDKFPYSLALYLSLLELYIIPSPEEVDGIIQDVQEKLQQYDEELDWHLKSSVTHNRRDSHQEGSPKNQERGHIGLSYLLQQWIREAFVGILRKPAVMFVWDQLFLQKWKPEVIGDICLSLIFLLRENLLNDVKDLQSLIKVLSEEPSRLFTMDIQSAYRHVSEGKDLNQVWKFNRKTRKGCDSPLEKSPTPEDGLDFYIDGIRHLPDNTTITKVTGRLTNPFLGVPDLLALPDLNSDAKSPTYTYRYTLDSVEKSNLILLRVYTVDLVTKAVAIVGSCITALCDEVDGQPRVKCGSIQLRVKQGLPKALSHLTEKVFNELPSVPGCSVLVRIQPKSEAFIERPPYHKDTYPHVFPLSEPEQEVMGRIISATSPSETEREVALSLRRTEEGATSEITDEDLRDWLRDRLDKEHMLLADKQAEQIPSSHLFYYNSKIGAKVKVLGGLGFKAENLYTGALVRTLPADPVEHGMEDSHKQGFIAATVDLESSMTGPRWTEETTLCHPSYDKNHLLFVEITGSKVTHKRTHSDQNLGFDMEKLSNLAWTIAPLFEGRFVSQGRHILPLFQHKDKSILERLTNEDYLTVFQNAMKSKKAVLSKKHLFVEVEIFDGRFEYKDVEPLQEKTDLLVQTGQLTALKTVNEIIQQGTHLSLLSKERKSAGLSEAEKLKIQETASKIFQDAVVSEAGRVF